MMHGFQQIVTQAEDRYNFVVHGLPPLGDEMRVSPLIWRKKLMDSIELFLNKIERSSKVQHRRQWHHLQSQLCNCGRHVQKCCSASCRQWHAQQRCTLESRLY